MGTSLLEQVDAYWPEYLAHHCDRGTRLMHNSGEAVVAVSALLALTRAQPMWLLPGVTGGYALSFLGHYGVERNTPATFDKPLLAAICNCKMSYLHYTGKLDAEFDRLGIEQTGERSFRYVGKRIAETVMLQLEAMREPDAISG